MTEQRGRMNAMGRGAAVLPVLCPKALNGKATRLAHFGSLEMKYYIFALDTTEGLITAALSCPHEQTAKKAYQVAKREFETEHGWTDSFHFGCASVDSQITIDYTMPPKGGYRNGWHTSARFDAEDFAFAAQQTRKNLSMNREGLDLLFMRYASSVAFLGFDPHAVEAAETFGADGEDTAVDTMPVAIGEGLKAPVKEPSKAPPILAARVKKKKESADKTTFKEYLENEPLVNSPDEVILEGHSKQAVVEIENAAFRGTFRAFARFKEPIDEAPIEKIHRLRCDGVEWKYIGRIIYREENGKDIAENDLDHYVDQLRQQHKREYPEHYPAKK